MNSRFYLHIKRCYKVNCLDLANGVKLIFKYFDMNASTSRDLAVISFLEAYKILRAAVQDLRKH